MPERYSTFDSTQITSIVNGGDVKDIFVRGKHERGVASLALSEDLLPEDKFKLIFVLFLPIKILALIY